MNFNSNQQHVYQSPFSFTTNSQQQSFPKLDDNFFGKNSKNALSSFSSLAKGEKSFFTSNENARENEGVENEDDCLDFTEDKEDQVKEGEEEKEEVNRFPQNDKPRFLVDDFSVYNFEKGEYNSKGRGVVSIEEINSKNYLVFRNGALKVMFLGEIVKGNSTFDIPKQNSLVGVVNKLLFFDSNGNVKILAVKMKFTSTDFRSAFSELFLAILLREEVLQEPFKETKEPSPQKVSNDSTINVESRPKVKVTVIKIKKKH